MKHANIALFIPHNGCPCRCSFCSQGQITGLAHQPGPDEVLAAVQTAVQGLGSRVENTEIAFFGGSFTAIEPGYMQSLLKVAHWAVGEYGLKGIRVSTRPDAVGSDILARLKSYGVTAIELGAQSMCDRVLALNRRGHDSQSVCHAAGRIRSMGFELGLQIMTGLYGSDDETDYRTAVKITELVPDTARIYPTVVFENTELCNLYRAGAYTPQSLQSAVALCARIMALFEDKGVRLLRVGLHGGGPAVAGPNHPAFKELCLSRLFLQRLTAALKLRGQNRAHVWVNPRGLSVALGQKRSNLQQLAALGYQVTIAPRADVPDFEIVDEKM